MVGKNTAESKPQIKKRKIFKWKMLTVETPKEKAQSDEKHIRGDTRVNRDE